MIIERIRQGPETPRAEELIPSSGRATSPEQIQSANYPLAVQAGLYPHHSRLPGRCHQLHFDEWFCKPALRTIGFEDSGGEACVERVLF